jgi:hypothetical protein
MSDVAPRSRSKYPTVEAAALGGFKKVLTQSPDFTTMEHSFLVVSEAMTVDNGKMYYRYTEPKAAEGRENTSWEIPPLYQPLVCALCHTHPKGDTFSSGDFDSFQQMQELTKKKTLKHAVVFYLMRGDGQIQWSNADNQKDFVRGAFVNGIDEAKP